MSQLLNKPACLDGKLKGGKNVLHNTKLC